MHPFYLLPSSVNVQLLVRGPNPAEVLAFIETLYGMYLSEETSMYSIMSIMISITY